MTATAEGWSTFKLCPKCDEYKPIYEFPRCRTRSDGHGGWCGECTRSYLRSGVKRKSVLKTTYGLTPEQYDQMLIDQGGVCASCGEPPSAKDRGGKLAVDHDHVTNAVRGLLCNLCNRALGLLRDDIRRIAALLLYRKRSQ